MDATSRTIHKGGKIMNLKRTVIVMLIKEFLSIVVNICVILWFVFLVVPNYYLKQELIESLQKNEVISNKIIEMNDQIDDLNKKIDELSARLPK